MSNVQYNDLIDLHNHLLFGLDDGASSMKDTIAMLDEAAANHITVIAATTHVLKAFDMDNYRKVLQEVQQEAKQRGITVIAGGEYNARYFPEQPPYITLGDVEGGAVLVDFRIPYLPPEFRGYVDSVFNAGNRLILAHPERTFPAALYFELEQLADAGVIFQVTSGSLLGKFGPAAQSLGWKLLEKGLARLVASDAHNATNRANTLAQAYALIGQKNGDEAVEILQKNAWNILNAPRTTLAPISVRRVSWNPLTWFRH